MLLIFNVISGIYQKRFWFCAVAKTSFCQCGCFGRHTVDSIFEVMAWAFGVQLCGWYPTLRDDGVAFKDSQLVGDKQRAKWASSKRRTRAKGGVVQKRADWSWLKSLIGLTGWGGEGLLKAVCYCCGANRTSLPFTDPSFGAHWRATKMTHEIFIARMMFIGGYISGIFGIPGFIYDYFSTDLMHCGDLGVNLYIEACVLYDLLVEMKAKWTDPKEQLNHLMMLIKQSSKQLDLDRQVEHRPPFNTLTMTMIRGKGAPNMKLKASESRRT